MDEREPILIGVDVRPLPLQVGPDVWYFKSDVGKKFFAHAARMAEIKKKGNDTDVIKVLDIMEDSLAAVLVPLDDRDQEAEFREKDYGIGVLTALTEKLTEELSDLPTEPSPDSGKARPTGGGSKSQRGTKKASGGGSGPA